METKHQYFRRPNLFTAKKVDEDVVQSCKPADALLKKRCFGSALGCSCHVQFGVDKRRSSAHDKSSS